MEPAPPPVSKYQRKLLMRRLMAAAMVDEPPPTTQAKTVRLPLLLDNYIKPTVAQAIRTMGYDASTAAKHGLIGATNEAQFKYAIEHGLGIVTHDHSFADPLRHDLSEAHGILILPGNKEVWRHISDSALRTFAAHYTFIKGMRRGRVLWFDNQGSLHEYLYNNRAPLSPTVRHSPYHNDRRWIYHSDTRSADRVRSYDLK